MAVLASFCVGGGVGERERERERGGERERERERVSQTRTNFQHKKAQPKTIRTNTPLIICYPMSATCAPLFSQPFKSSMESLTHRCGILTRSKLLTTTKIQYKHVIYQFALSSRLYVSLFMAQSHQDYEEFN